MNFHRANIPSCFLHSQCTPCECIRHLLIHTQKSVCCKFFSKFFSNFLVEKRNPYIIRCENSNRYEYGRFQHLHLKKGTQTMCARLWTFIAIDFIDSSLLEVLRNTHDALRIETDKPCSVAFLNIYIQFKCYFLQTNAWLKYVHSNTVHVHYLFHETNCGNLNLFLYQITYNTNRFQSKKKLIDLIPFNCFNSNKRKLYCS